MGTDIAEKVAAAGDESQYDEKAKELLANKQILAHILVKTIDEFKGMKPQNVVKCIEGEPYVAKVPVDPGMTNVKTGTDEKECIYGTANCNGKSSNNRI